MAGGIQCATTSEVEEFFANSRISLLLVDEFMKLDEEDTDDALKTRVQETLFIDSLNEGRRKVKGSVGLSVNEAIMQDYWYGFYDRIFEEESKFVSIDSFS